MSTDKSRPGIEHLRIDGIDVAVGVDVGAREIRCDQGATHGRHVRPQRLHVRVLTEAQRLAIHGMAEVNGVVGAAVR